MRISIDLDGVICPVKAPEVSYSDLEPLAGCAEAVKALRSAGHYLIIVTARNMATCESNVGKVMKNVGKLTLDWLDKHGIEYDEIYFGKPNADVYVDDRAVRFSCWSNLTESVLTAHARPR